MSFFTFSENNVKYNTLVPLCNLTHSGLIKRKLYCVLCVHGLGKEPLLTESSKSALLRATICLAPSLHRNNEILPFKASERRCCSLCFEMKRREHLYVAVQRHACSAFSSSRPLICFNHISRSLWINQRGDQ